MNITLTRAPLSTFHNREYNFNAKIITILSKKNIPLHVKSIIVSLNITVVTEILCKNFVSVWIYSPYFMQ